MTMTTETIIQESEDTDDSKIPQVKYDFVSIENIASMEPNALVGKFMECLFYAYCHLQIK